MSKEKTLSVDPKKKRLQTQILVIAIVVAAFVVCHFITGGRLLAPNNLRDTGYISNDRCTGNDVYFYGRYDRFIYRSTGYFSR